MVLILIGTGLWVGVSLVAALLCWCVARLRGPVHTGWWRRAGVVLAALLPVHALVLTPLTLGAVGAFLAGTRPDERGYAGPRFGPDGSWQMQSRATLEAATQPGFAPGPHAELRWLTTSDGVRLRAFRIRARGAPCGVAAVLVHGLFRSAFELETVAGILRERGVELLLVELRNHGGSQRSRCTLGRLEAEDVLAGVAELRADPVAAEMPVLLFGVSLGAVAVALAAPRVGDLAGLVLDSPVTDLPATAERMLGTGGEHRPRRIALPQPFRSLTLLALEIWTGTGLDELRPLQALEQVPLPVASLVIAGALDDRVHPDEARRAYTALRAPESRKEFWLVTDAGHGDAWRTEPREYAQRLERLLERIQR